MAATDAMKTMPWITWLDLDTELGEDGSVRSILRRPKPEHINHNGDVNAPVIYGVAEVAGAGAAVVAAGAAGTGAYTVIRSATIAYQRPANGGITASSRVDPAVAADIRRTLQAGEGCDIDVDVSLTDASGTYTGACKFVVTMRPRRTDRD
ncbi:YiiD C-terminal domain-containing protein [Rhodococcus sp. NPDC049939]|uniref:YiiD C-terminal domain-containing protein n=1 Tax=Rhodococcus sp. NPDC049939 TaxID=3155511 RepID=UPI0033C12ACD